MYTLYLTGDRNNNEKPGGTANLGGKYLSAVTQPPHGATRRLRELDNWPPRKVFPRAEMMGQAIPHCNTASS